MVRLLWRMRDSARVKRRVKRFDEDRWCAGRTRKGVAHMRKRGRGPSHKAATRGGGAPGGRRARDRHADHDRIDRPVSSCASSSTARSKALGRAQGRWAAEDGRRPCAPSTPNRGSFGVHPRAAQRRRSGAGGRDPLEAAGSYGKTRKGQNSGWLSTRETTSTARGRERSAPRDRESSHGSGRSRAAIRGRQPQCVGARRRRGSAAGRVEHRPGSGNDHDEIRIGRSRGIHAERSGGREAL